MRERLFYLLESDSKQKTALLQRLTPEEQKAFRYRFHTVPGIGKVAPDRIPAPPFPEAKMRQLLQSAALKVIHAEIDGILDDEGGS
jgi:hypothetical protein